MPESSFREYLIERLKAPGNAKAYLIEAIEDGDQELLLDTIQLIIQALGPTKISELAGGSKQRWAALKNPTYKTITQFLAAFNLKLSVKEMKD